MANPLLTNALDLANHTASGIWQKNIKSGIIGSLTPDEPQIMVGSTDFFTFTGTPKAELVGEGANKSSMDGTPAKKTSKTYKVQLTYRFSDEVRYADEEYRLRLMEALAGRIATGVSRAVDLVAIHGVNPATGQVAEGVVDYITKSGNGHVINSTSATPEVDLDAAAAALQGSGYSATGIALDPVYAGVLARTKKTNGDRVFPELGLGFNVDRIAGIQAAVSNTVSGTAEGVASATGVGGIMADWNAIKWGIARNVPLHLIEYGDPDGAGDLQRTNEIAIRAEVVFGFAILDDDAFAIIKQAQVSA
jgi:hypothetical protein